MGLDTKPNIDNEKFEQFTGDTISLSGTNEYYGSIIVKSGGTFQFVDGNEGVCKIIISDANGKASWGVINWSDTDWTPTLQEVTDSGDTTTNSIYIGINHTGNTDSGNFAVGCGNNFNEYHISCHSVAFGGYNTMLGCFSMVQGAYNQAGHITEGKYGVNVEGIHNSSSGNYSHTEGSYNRIILGDYSHAEGYSGYTCGIASHIEGCGNKIELSGKYSHAEGVMNCIGINMGNGEGSHVEGYNNIICSKYSHAEGYKTVTCANYSHSQGLCTTTKAEYQMVGGKYNIGCSTTLFEIGIGSSNILRCNAFEVYNDGNIGIPYIDTATGDSVLYISATGKITKSSLPDNPDLSNFVSNACNGLTKVDDTIVLGGANALTGDTVIKSGGYGLGFGDNVISTGDTSFAHGYNTIATGNSSHAEGRYAKAYGVGSHAEGSTTYSYGIDSHAEGIQTKAYGDNSHAEGNDTYTTGNYSHAEGIQTSATTLASHSEGYGTISYGLGSHTEGVNTITYGDYSHTEGDSNISCGNSSHAEGSSTLVTGTSSHSEGCITKVYGDYSHAEGYNNTIHADFSHAEGYGILICSGATASHAEGHNTKTIGVASHAEGASNIACGQVSHVEGVGNTSIGDNSHAEGENNLSKGSSSHAEGDDTISCGIASHAEGNGTISYGLHSHAEGLYSHAYGLHSHAEGEYTVASGKSSHSQGLCTIANADYQLVGGKYNMGSGNTLFEIGVGVDNSNRCNAFEVYNDGQIGMPELNIQTGDSLLHINSVTGLVTQSSENLPHVLSSHTDVEFVLYSAVTTGSSIVYEIPDDAVIEYDKTKEKWVNKPNIWYFDEDRKVIRPREIDVDVEVSTLKVNEDGGRLIITQMNVTTGSTEDTENSYIFQVGNKDVFRIYSIADGVGSVKEASAILDGDYFYLGDPLAINSWRYYINSNGDFIYERFNGTNWVEMQTISSGDTYTFANGLTKVGNTVVLGGANALTGGTLIKSGGHGLAFGCVGTNTNVLSTGDTSFAFGSVGRYAGCDSDTKIESSGDGSFAFGYSYAYNYHSCIIATGCGSFAGGMSYADGAQSSITVSTGKGSFAIGFNNSGYIGSTCNGSIAMGSAHSYGEIKSICRGSIAMGYTTYGCLESSNKGSIVMGNAREGYMKSSGNGSFAGGYANSWEDLISSGNSSFAFGKNVCALEDQSVAFGLCTISSGNTAKFVIGKYNEIKSDTILEVGIGTSNANRCNVLEAKTSGDIIMSKLNTGASDNILYIDNNGKVTKSDELTSISGNSVLLNNTSTQAKPKDFVLPVNTVLGRESSNIEAIDIVDVYDLSTTTKDNLSNTSNWSNKTYSGPSITDGTVGKKYYNSDYLFEFVSNNIPIRISRI